MADTKQLSWPFSPVVTANPTLNGLSLNTSARMVAVCFQAENTEPITHIGFRHTSTTGTSPTYRVSVQGINGSGRPDGTVKGGGSPASATFSPSSLAYGANTWQWVSLSNSYTPTRSEFLSLVIDYSSGTVDASNFSSFLYYFSGGLDFGFPFGLDFQAAWTPRTGTPLIAYKTATRSYLVPYQASVVQTFSSSSSPNEYGIRFTIPANITGTLCLSGVTFLMSLPAASTFSLNLYSGGNASDTTSIATLTSADGDFTASALGNRLHQFLFTTPTLPTLNAGSTYRIALAPSTVSATLYGYDVASNADFSAHPFGIDAYWTSRSGGNWTDTTTRRPFGFLHVVDMSGGGGGGGSLINSQQLVRQGWI